MSEAPTLQPVGPAWLCRLPQCEAMNNELLAQFRAGEQLSETRRTHMLFGRYENIYLPPSAVPALQPLAAAALACAEQIRPDAAPLRWGCWFNAMAPGDLTSRHAHEELDELLSCVYYVSAADNSGDLVLHAPPARIAITPEPGLCVFFPPDLPHEVEVNASQQLRLSVAFNFGPVSADAPA